NSATPITHPYTTSTHLPSNVDSWEEDILGNDILSAYSSIQISIDDNRAICYYDFKAIFSDGAETTHYGIDVCDLSRYTF
ncbi:MAG: hypothetical protein HC800_23825, partial [Phormidesmis sp. RL_2_1]|nr:hypothetical protein [Phormidesmis sp. RL_2_1]